MNTFLKLDHVQRFNCSMTSLVPKWITSEVKAVRNGDLKILPEFHHQTWYNWLENIQEWCISRQLWWGHRIPAYKVIKPAQKEEKWYTGKTAAEAAAKAEKDLGQKARRAKNRGFKDVENGNI